MSTVICFLPQKIKQQGESPAGSSSALYFLYDSTKYTVAKGSPF